MDSQPFEENLSYLSTLGRYNTERRPLIREYFNQQLLDGHLSEEIVSIEDVREFAKEETPNEQDDNLGFNEAFERALLTLPEDINPQDFQQYLLFRYDHLEQPLKEANQFAIYDLLSFEALLRDTVLGDTDTISSEVHRFISKEEYIEPASIHESSDQFSERWASNIRVDTQQILNEFVERTLPDDPTLGPERVDERITAGQEILAFLTYSSDHSAQMDFFSNPLYREKEDRSKVLIPFPELLLTTAQYRIEEYIAQFDEVQATEDQQKGDLVEELAQALLQQIPSRNFIKNFQYVHDPHPGEADGVIFFDDAYWTVEVKSHPIFRKIPQQIELVKKRYLDKVTQALTQTRRANEYLCSVDDLGLVYNLTGQKSPNSMETGGLVVLDGFIPTLFSGNERADSQLGMGELHEELATDERLVVITLYDLFQLLQEEETEYFDSFLRWRTDYGGDHPIWGYNEREYWAFYFDIFRGSEQWTDALETAVEKEIITIYISERFNNKSHLENLVD